MHFSGRLSFLSLLHRPNEDPRFFLSFDQQQRHIPKGMEPENTGGHWVLQVDYRFHASIKYAALVFSGHPFGATPFCYCEMHLYVAVIKFSAISPFYISYLYTNLFSN